MKNLIFFVVLVVVYSCNNKPETTTGITPTPTGMQGLQQNKGAESSLNAPKPNLVYNPAHGQPGHTCALAVGAPLNQNAAIQQPLNITRAAAPATKNTAPAETSTAGVKLNPKHGAPNHRCDIAVGAPLSSKAAQSGITTVNAKAINVSATSIVSAKGVNPKHGEPNHRCDIPVGAPLNSKPVAAAKTTPVQISETKNSETKGSVKLNPKHGELDHRCDIAVGAPLT
ncbi:MAG: hypothetical protein EOP55_04235 [Sphingobacteriales bacterium]|nr:MAG: hypothetical protein EOP55_04235 [Sphingobacteriales bacterium]